MATIETNKQTDHICWSCYQPTGGKPFCPDCLWVQLHQHEADYFSILGLDARRMSLEPESLEEAFYALSRLVHPDRYQTRNPKERRITEECAALVNVAYRTLRDPIARTEYLLELETGSPQEHRDQPPAELLSQLMEIEEIVEAYQGSGGAERGARETACRGSPPPSPGSRGVESRCRGPRCRGGCESSQMPRRSAR